MGRRNSQSLIKLVVVIAIGSALYGVGGMLGVPIFANSTLKPAMAVLALIGVLYGPIAGFLVGFIGHWLTDMLMGWGVWPTWMLGSAIVGLLLGLFGRITSYRLDEGIFKAIDWVILAALSLVANFLGYTISALLDYFLFSEPLNKVFTQMGLIALTNTIVIVVIGGIILKIVADRNKEKTNLVEEE